MTQSKFKTTNYRTKQKRREQSGREVKKAESNISEQRIKDIARIEKKQRELTITKKNK